MEKDLPEMLHRCGVKKNDAKVIGFLVIDHEFHTLHDIERACDLRQPEVSLAVQRLALSLEIVKQKRGSADKGAPMKVVRMTPGLYAGYLDRLKIEAEQEYRNRLDVIAVLMERGP